MFCPSCHGRSSRWGLNTQGASPPFCTTCGATLPPDPLIGLVIGERYTITAFLGEGAVGAVYLGHPLGAPARRVAIKTLQPHLAGDPMIRARFEREAGALASLEHPNTVQIFDFGAMDDGNLFMVMEFIEGRSISDVVDKDGAFSADRVAKIVAQIGGALAEAHAKGIIHRDLTPSGILLTERDGRKDFVTILDFGIVTQGEEEAEPSRVKRAKQLADRLSPDVAPLARPPTMSPEQFAGRPLDARSNVYSLAVMAYEMLTDTLPFEAATAFEWATLHMTGSPKAIEVAPHGAGLPESMRSAITRALAKSPDQRFSTVREFVDRFTSHAGGPSA